MRVLTTLAAAAVALTVSAALAEPKIKPAIRIDTRAVEIEVSVDPYLRSFPGLATNLLAEGRRFANKARAEAAKEFKTNPDWFTEGRRWSYSRNYGFRSSVVGRYVSVLREDSVYAGGAHPNSTADTILWDVAGKRRISIRGFFNETADNGPTMNELARLVRLAVATEKKARWRHAADEPEKAKAKETPEQIAATDEQLKERVEPSLLKIGPISLAPSTAPGKSSGLTVHYSPYDVDAYAAGPYTVFVPWSELKPYLSAEGAAIFEGRRPRSDEERFSLQ
jgi:hypothetical protein